MDKKKINISLPDSTIAAFQKLNQALNKNSIAKGAFQQILENSSSTAKSLQRLNETLNNSSIKTGAFQQILENSSSSAKSLQRLNETLNNSSIKTGAFQQVINSMQENILSNNSLTDVINRNVFQYISRYELADNIVAVAERNTIIFEDLDEKNIQNIFEDLDSSHSFESFEQKFNNLSLSLRTIFMLILINVMLAMVVNISSNIATPHVQDYLNNNNNKTKRDLISDIKKLKFDTLQLKKSNFRFITVQNLHLREDPSTKSKILDNLTFGQVVSVVSKSKNWIEVQYTYEDNEQVYHGWVFTSYTSKFK